MIRRHRTDEPADQWSGWSYYGAAHRYDVHDTPEATAACDRLMDRLESARDERTLRKLAYDDGNACAFVRLAEMMVDADRLTDLRTLALDGDGRAFATLMELLVREGRVEQLRAEVPVFASARAWLAHALIRRGDVNGALVELELLESDPEHGHFAHSERLNLLLAHGRVEEVRALAEAGDRPAARRLKHWLASAQ